MPVYLQIFVTSYRLAAFIYRLSNIEYINISYRGSLEAY